MMHGLPSNQMTETQYDAERAKLRERGETSTERTARWEQELANLYYRSGWSQDHLAKKEGNTQSWISYRLLFGRFLNFINENHKPEKLPDKLTCGHFLKLYKQTEGMSEGPRFRDVIRLLQEPALKSNHNVYRRLGPAIMDEFADGKWHKLETIVSHLDAPQHEVEATLHQMQKKGSNNCKCEREKIGRSFQYRIFKQDKTVSVHELIEKLRPLVDGLKAEGKKGPATTSPGTVARLAALIERQLDEWDE